jgi:hypothetical protein
MKTPFYKTGNAKTPLFNHHVPGHPPEGDGAQNRLPDPYVTKPKQARQMKRAGEITKSEFKDYKQARKANKEAFKTVNTANVNEEGVRGTAKRSQWKRKVKKGKKAIETGRKMSTAIKEGASNNKIDRLTKRYDKQKTKAEEYRKKIVKFDGTSTIGKQLN